MKTIRKLKGKEMCVDVATGELHSRKKMNSTFDAKQRKKEKKN